MPVPVAARWKVKAHSGETIAAIQEPGGLEYIYSVVQEFAPTIIVEFGTQAGGVTIAMHEASPQAEIFSFDRCNLPDGEFISKEWGPTRRELFGDNVHFIAGDVLKEHSGIQMALNLEGRKLLYCDNGKKALEVQMWAPLLKAGDMLGVHDWGEEITEDDIAGVLVDYEPYRQEELAGKYILSRFWIRRK